MAKDLNNVSQIVFICNGDSCSKKGAEHNTLVLRNKITECGIQDTTHTIKTKCCGQCEHGPVVFMQSDNIWYQQVDETTATEIVTAHLVQRRPLDDKILYGGIEKPA